MNLFDIYGHPHGNLNVITAGMTMPVRCAFCNRVYDLGKVKVTARYADCSMWKTPCCSRTADDRGETGWKSTKDYYVLPRGGES